ncbi:MAG: GNAT family N-acetyltransferase [Gaiellaceae bacterium]
MTITLRAPELEDLGSAASLLNAHAQALFGGDDMDESELRSFWTSPGLDYRRDIRLAYTAEGELAGYVDVSDVGGRHLELWLDARVHPAYPAEVGAELLGWAEERARELAAAAPGGERPVARGGTWSADAAGIRLLEESGYRLIRHSFRMEIALDDQRPEPPHWPAGIRVRPLQPGVDDRAVYDAQNDAFADTWDYHADPYEEWAHYLLGAEDLDATLNVLATDGEEIAAIALCRPHEPGDPELGWVRILGVRPPWRRRGLALALLRHVFGEFHDRGLRRVALGVDAENPTGATRLYERAGMRVVRRFDMYEKDLWSA